MRGTEHFVGDFQKLVSRADRPVPPWVSAVREAAIARFAEIGFPTTREEDWKYTNVSRLVSVPYRAAIKHGERPVDAGLREASLVGDGAVARLVFVNGGFVKGASDLDRLPPGVRVESLAATLARDGESVAHHLARHAAFDRNGFTALSTAFLDDGAFVFVSDGVELERPIELVFASSGGGGEVVAHPRLLVVCGSQSRAMLVEQYVATGDGSTLTNAVGEVVLEEGARFDHVRLVREGERGAHVATTEVVQGRDSRYRSLAIVLGAAFLRHNLNVTLGAEGAECVLDGLYLAAGKDFVDHHTAIDHAVPHGTSRELYKGIVAGEAKAVFNGKVIVRANAQKSDAQQTNKNLLLSDRAEVDSKPELQILADDVKCAHGAAIGQLDPDALFYLASRGIGEALSRRLLTHGFAAEVIQRVPIPELRPVLERILVERLERGLVEDR
ncbi:MAG TPA: Fe-S cluster assembly protein SufD [Candidatus Binatia bacterium]|nr:Fe-S cluster assembly protein SufD [Candidatus Binatia bacterium]